VSLSAWNLKPSRLPVFKEITKATIRCMPLEGKIEKGICVLTGRESARRVLFAKAY